VEVCNVEGKMRTTSPALWWAIALERVFPRNGFCWHYLKSNHLSVSIRTWFLCWTKTTNSRLKYEVVSKSFRTGRLEREVQMVQLSATRCSCITILWVSLVYFIAITLNVASQRVFIVVYFAIDSVRKLLDTPSYMDLATEPLFYLVDSIETDGKQENDRKRRTSYWSLHVVKLCT
jgi:hypothetical protein